MLWVTPKKKNLTVGNIKTFMSQVSEGGIQTQTWKTYGVEGGIVHPIIKMISLRMDCYW